MSSPTEGFVRRWRDWRSVLDLDALRVAYSPAQGVVVGCFLLLFAGVGSLLPGARDVLEVRAGAFGAAVAPAWLLTMLTAAIYSRDRLSARIAPALLVLGAVLVSYEAGCLLTFSGERAAPAIGGLVALTCVAHGHQGRASVRYPYLTFADGLGLLAASIWAPSKAHRVYLGVSGIGGILAGLVVGSAAEQSVRARQANESMRGALEAQIAADRAAKAAALEGLVLDARARSHDVSNALTTALIDLELLTNALETRGEVEAEEARVVLEALDTAIRLTRTPMTHAAPGREPIALAPAVTTIVQSLRSRFAGVSFEVEIDERETSIAHVENGAVGLRRILENLLINAAEGDGKKGANRVVVRVRPGDGGMAFVEVQDDGPGFSSAQLAAPIEGFSTTKPNGTGLGLYTVENLARASSGWVERRNADEGGAILTVAFPMELEARSRSGSDE